jgi:hypothetical protein
MKFYRGFTLVNPLLNTDEISTKAAILPRQRRRHRMQMPLQIGLFGNNIPQSIDNGGSVKPEGISAANKPP